MFKWIDDYIEKREELEKISNVTIPYDDVQEDELGVLTGKMTKTAEFKLEHDSNLWTEQILERLYDEHDWIEPENYYVKWRNEYDDGNALGVLILEKNNKEINIPIIVENYYLKDLDLFYDPNKKKMRPLTPHNIEKVFFNPEFTDDLANPQRESGKIMQNVFAPHSGRYVHASADPEMIDNIKLEESDVADFSARIKNDDILFNANQNDDYMKTAKKILNKPIKEVKEEIEKTAALIEPDDEGYKVTIKTDKGLETKTASYYETYGTLKEAFDMDKKEVDEEVSKVDEGKIVTVSKKETSSVIDKPEVKRIVSSTPAKLEKAQGGTIEAYVIPRVLRIKDGQLMPEGTLVIDENRELLDFSDKVVGKPIDKEKSLMDIMRAPRNEKPVRNDFVSFIWYDKRLGDYVGLRPAKLLDFKDVQGLGRMFTILTSFGHKCNVIIAKHLAAPDFSRSNKHDAILLPENANWLKQGDEVKFSDNPASIKEAMLKDYTPFKAKYFRSTDTFDFLDKEASPEEVTLDLAEMGVQSNKIKEFIKESAMNKEAEIYIEIKQEKTATEEEKPPIEEFKQDTVKLASKIKSEKMIDQILSINFINDKNIAFFFKKLPKFKETVDSLCALLLATRLGKIGVDEYVIKEAVQSMQDLIEKMEGYKFE